MHDGDEVTPGFAALRPQYRLELVQGSVEATESVVAVDATVVVALTGRFAVRIAGNDIEIREGSIALIDSGVAFAVEGEGRRLTIAFAEPMLGDAVARLGREGRGEVVFARAVAPVDDALGLALRRVVLELERDGSRSIEALDLSMSLVALDVVRAHATTDRPARLERSRAGLVDRRLRRSIEFMHDNFARELGLAEIASAAYLSEFHFARLFKRITGVTPHTYLAGLRMDHARRLLASTGNSISDVAQSVGYQSASHFGKVFRMATGFTPTEYRELSVRTGSRERR